MADIEISTHYKKYYEDYYAEGDSEWRWLGAISKANNITSLCNNLSHKSVIEIGAGEGSILKRLSELKFADEYFALDISPTGIKAINMKNIPRLVACTLFDGYNIPYGNGKFDLAILSHVIEHVEYPRKILYEAARVAKYIFIEVPLEDNIRLKKEFVFDRTGHINFYSQKTINMLVRSCNLNIIHHAIFNSPKSIYMYEKGKKGVLNYYIKQLLLNHAPNIATSISCYHMALVCELNE